MSHYLAGITHTWQRQRQEGAHHVDHDAHGGQHKPSRSLLQQVRTHSPASLLMVGVGSGSSVDW